MKKILSIVSILLILMAWFCAKPVFASPDEADGQEVLDNKLVPTEGRVALVNTTFDKAIKLDSSFTKTGDMATKLSYKGLVGEIDGVPVIKVPSSYMPTNCEFIITHPIATINPKKLTDYKIHRDPPGINGNLIEGRVRYDTFVLEGKKDAIYAHYTELSA